MIKALVIILLLGLCEPIFNDIVVAIVYSEPLRKFLSYVIKVSVVVFGVGFVFMLKE